MIVNATAVRPAGKPTECFYCRQPIGAEHGPRCVLVRRTVRVRFTVEYEIERPAHWDDDAVEAHGARSTWCKNNALNEIQNFAEANGGCLCSHAKIEVIKP